MKLSGEIVSIMELQQKSEKFALREFVVEVVENPKYPQQICFTAMSTDALNAVAELNEGEFVDVEFNINGRSWEGKNGTRWFNTLRAYKITKVGGAVPRTEEPPQRASNADREPERNTTSESAPKTSDSGPCPF